MKRQNSTHKKERANQSGNTEDQHLLVLFNDEIHDFSYVIESLVEVCNHDNVQAEQCTYLAHYNGRCEIKKGGYDDLKAMKQALIERGLQAEIH
jgi:ATP-dependent Clp protease adaptor protein ClpS